MIIERMRIFIENKYKIAVFFFFAAYLVIGISIFKDYGVSWDDFLQREVGVTAVDYLLNGSRGQDTFQDHGQAFEILLVSIEKIFRIEGSWRVILFIRHLLIFLLFYISVFFFFLLCKSIFKNWKLALLGCLFLILSPRIFADSFYNSKDIVFLSLFIIGIYTLVVYEENKNIAAAFIHGFVSAILIDIRVAGILLPFFTAGFFIAGLFRGKREKADMAKMCSSFLIYILSLCVFIIFFWPALWESPVINFLRAIKSLAHFQWIGSVLYFGNYLPANSLPWHYIPVWICITTPVAYTVFFLRGVIDAFNSLICPGRSYSEKKFYLVFLIWLFLPVASAIILKSVLYDGWRHMFFIYPAFIIFSLAGLKSVFGALRIARKNTLSLSIKYIIIFLISLNIANVVKFMVKYHPFQNVYFNVLAGKDMQGIKDNFELDYWGLSYRKALEYILKNDNSEVIRVCTENIPGLFNAFILTMGQRERLEYVGRIEEAKYFLSNYRYHKEEYPFKDEYYSIKINGAKIMVVYKLS